MVDTKQIERLYNQSYFSYLATYFGGALAYWFFYDITPEHVLNTWFIVFTVVVVIRCVTTWQFNKRENNNNIDAWLILFLIMTGISGTMWGLTGFLFIPEGLLSLLDSILYQGILLIFIASLIAGSIITYSASKTVFLVFSVPAIVPQSFMLIAQGDKYHSFLGGVMLTYLFIMFVISIYIHRVFNEYSKIEMRNERLELELKNNGINID